MYNIPLASGLAAVSGTGAASLPQHTSDPVLASTHQVLAFTGFAFGAYVILALALIVAGLVIRKFADAR